MTCIPHRIADCPECRRPKPHGPVSERFMRHHYGAAKPNFPESQKREGLGVALIMMAWEAGELSEGQVAKLLAVDRVTLRAIRQDTINAGLALSVTIGGND